jgi:D-aminopeptidase
VPRPRIRDLGIQIGRLPIGQYNAITDVRGVCVGHATIIHDHPHIARTGVTVILPRTEPVWLNHAFAGFQVLNGNGDFTGTHWIEESGLLTTPIALTNTHQVGLVRDTLVAYEMQHTPTDSGTLPLVAETYDGWLNDINAFPLRQEHVLEAISNARSGIVQEGNVGGGTGTICFDFKGGIGTSSRLVETLNGEYTVGALVQTNFGDRQDFRIDGIPVGRALTYERVPSGWDEPPLDGSGSVIVILATDAPLLATQCKRLARRAAIGLARTGCVGHNGSGDLFLAFSTGNNLPINELAVHDLKMLPAPQMNGLFEAAVESVEEAVLNSLTAAETMVGQKGRVAYAMPIDDVRRIMRS